MDLLCAVCSAGDIGVTCFSFHKAKLGSYAHFKRLRLGSTYFLGFCADRMHCNGLLDYGKNPIYDYFDLH